MKEPHVPLARVLLGSRAELHAIWTESGNLEYYVQTEQGVTMRVTPQDANTLATMTASGSKARWG